MPEKYNKDGTIRQSTEEARNLNKEFKEISTDFGKALTKAIKKATITGSSQFKLDFLSAAAAVNVKISKNFTKLHKHGVGDIAKEYTAALAGASTGAVTPEELKSISDKFYNAMVKETPDIAKELKDEIEQSLGNLQLNRAQANMEKAVTSGIKSAFDIIPKNSFTAALGIDVAVEAFSETMGKAISDRFNNVGLYTTLKDNMGKAVLLGLVAGMTMWVVSGLRKITDTVGKSFGAIGVTKFKGDLLGAKVTADTLGLSFDDVVTSATTLSNKFGIAFKDAIGISKAAMKLGVATGISTDEASNLMGIFMTMGGHTTETAENLIKQTHALAASAGVAPGAVLKDMSESSEDIAKFTKGTGTNMFKAAVQARRMGVSLSDTVKMAEGLLDFESSISKELTASILLNRRIDLSKARHLALGGKIEESVAEMLKHVGSEQEFLGLMLPQRQALADLLNTDLTTMTKMVKMQGKSALELARMGEHDISKIVPREAIDNISELLFLIKALGTFILSGFASLSTFFGLIPEKAPVSVRMIGALVSVVAALAATFYITGFALKLLSKAFASSAPSMATFGVAGMTAVPALAAIALVGLVVAGMLYLLPPIINSITDSIKVMADIGIGGLAGVAGGFIMLAGALSLMAVAGLAAMPTLMMIGGIAAASSMGAGIGAFFGAGGGGNNSTPKGMKDYKNTAEGKVMVEISSKLTELLNAFGATDTKGGIVDAIGERVGEEVVAAIP